MSGTIDIEGFRKDLASIANNDYPPLGLVKLPFNWFTPAGAGIRQFVSVNANSGTPGVMLFPAPITAGNTILVFAHSYNPGVVPVVSTVDSKANAYTHINPGASGVINNPGGFWDGFICLSAAGGSTTVTTSTVGAPQNGCIAIEIAGVLSLDSFGGSYNATGAIAGSVGDLAICFASSDWNQVSTAWTDSAGWGLLTNFQGGDQSHVVTQTMTGVSVANAVGAINNSGQVVIGIVTLKMSTATGATTPAPITNIPLPGPCNLISLVSEAIDEQGQYQQSALLGEQAAAGWLRLNGQGNVWFPVAFASPLTPGYVTTSNNYKNTPIAGTGFQSLQAPFGSLEWRPAAPIQYSGAAPPTTPAGFLLAFVGLNVGVGAAVGNGDSSTYAIPSAAGPIAREKAECLL